MQIRNIRGRLLALRLVGVLTLGATAAAFFFNYPKLGYSLAILWICLALIKATSVWVSGDVVFVQRFYVFGAIPVTYNNASEDQEFQLVNYSDINHLSHTGELLDFITLFFPLRSHFRGLIVRHIRKPGEIGIALTEEEFQKLQALI